MRPTTVDLISEMIHEAKKEKGRRSIENNISASIVTSTTVLVPSRAVCNDKLVATEQRSRSKTPGFFKPSFECTGVRRQSVAQFARDVTEKDLAE